MDATYVCWNAGNTSTHVTSALKFTGDAWISPDHTRERASAGLVGDREEHPRRVPAYSLLDLRQDRVEDGK